MRVLLGLATEGEVNMTRFQELSGISSGITAADLRDTLASVRLIEKEEFRDEGRLNYRLRLSPDGAKVARAIQHAVAAMAALPKAPSTSVRGLPRAKRLDRK